MKLLARRRKNWRQPCVWLCAKIGGVFFMAAVSPQQQWPKMAAKIKKLRMPVVVVRQTGRELYNTKERLPDLILEYPNV